MRLIGLVVAVVGITLFFAMESSLFIPVATLGTLALFLGTGKRRSGAKQ